MKKSFEKIIKGYEQFKQTHQEGSQEKAALVQLAEKGQHPLALVIACCDSRVDPSILLQCEAGEIFVIRNVANLVPPFEKDEGHHGVSAAIEFGLCYLNIPHLIILGHSRCGGIEAFLHQERLHQDDFLSRWLSLIESTETKKAPTVEACAKASLLHSYHNALSFPWITSRIQEGKLQLHLWFYDLDKTLIEAYDVDRQSFLAL
jgi:carbonic anhydrase